MWRQACKSQITLKRCFTHRAMSVFFMRRKWSIWHRKIVSCTQMWLSSTCSILNIHVQKPSSLAWAGTGYQPWWLMSTSQLWGVAAESWQNMCIFVKCQLGGCWNAVTLHRTNHASKHHWYSVDRHISEVCWANYTHFRICVTGNWHLFLCLLDRQSHRLSLTRIHTHTPMHRLSLIYVHRVFVLQKRRPA